jgi:hypothetical protein
MPSAAVSDIIRRRLANQRLVGTGHARAIDVIRDLVAVQSQDYFGGRWAIAQRMAGAGATGAAIEADFNRGAFVRTHVLRPTWHFVAPEDIRWLHVLTGPRVNAIMGRYDDKLGLTPAVHRKCQDVFTKALSGGKHLTRQELKRELVRAKVRVVNGEALARIVMRAEQAALITSGPRRGKQFTYALMDEWVAPTPAKSRDESLGELMRRYFTTRGPATVHDCAWWSGLTLADVKRGIEIAGRAVRREEIDGRDYWSVERDVPRSKPSAHLLPNYDEYFIGFRDRSAIGHRIGSIESVTGGNALIANVVAINGELVGGWKHKGEGRRASIPLKLIRLSAAERKLIDAQIVRLRKFLG